MATVSVIIPVYGVEKYIERCARSLFEQTLDDLEFIFVDDCTNDHSIDILLNIIKDYPHRKEQIEILHHDTNQGLPAARQTGLKAAKGQFIINCDSDDWVEPDLYKAMYCKAEKELSDVVICDCIRTDGTDNEFFSGGSETNHTSIINQMCHRKVWWSLCNKLFKAELFKDLTPPAGAMGEDMCLCLQLMTRCKSISYVHSVYYYYVNPNSIIQSNNPETILRKFSEICANIKIVQDFFEDKSIRIFFEKGLHYLEYNAMQVLVPGLDDTRVMTLWKTSFPRCFQSVLFDRDAIFKERVRSLFIIMGIYPFAGFRKKWLRG